MVFLCIPIILYLCIILCFSYGIHQLKQYNETINKEAFSIIVAFRNEENNIYKLINSLKKIDYPYSEFEVVLVNDHSTDRTLQIIEKEINNYPNFKVIQNNIKKYGKKEAIIKGVKEAKFEFIVCTDADCIVPDQWLNEINKTLYNTNAEFIAGPVSNMNKKSFLEKFQYYEQNSLSYSTAGSFGINSPIMCSGANLSFSKKFFLNNYNEIKLDLSSGDDMFLLLHAKEIKTKTAYIYGDNSIVYTKAHSNLAGFWQQRKRWAAKSPHYKDAFVLLNAIVVYFASFSLLTTLLFSFIKIIYFKYFVVFFLLKNLADIILYFKGKKVIRNRYSDYIWLTIFQIFYFIYISLIAPLAIFGRFKWKERSLRV